MYLIEASSAIHLCLNARSTFMTFALTQHLMSCFSQITDDVHWIVERGSCL